MSIAESFPPLVGSNARVLILGSMPGGASLAAGEYYAHPRNAFWPLMGELVGVDPTLCYAERCSELVAKRIAVWDVLRECVREGSLDANIEPDTELANDLPALLAANPTIERLLFNGQKAEASFRRHIMPGLDPTLRERLSYARVPSTSPAHAALSFEQKLLAWQQALLES